MSGLAIRSRRKPNEHKIAKSIWDTAKEVLRQKFIAIQAYLKIIEISQTKKPKAPSTRTREIAEKQIPEQVKGRIK